MKYMLLIYSQEDIGPEGGTPEWNDYMAGFFRFNEEAGAAGVLVGGEPLEKSTTATTVRVRDGERLVTDGPFAETKEVLGGYYLLDCDNLDDALAWAAKIPTAALGSVEVRPLMEIPGG